MYSISKEFTCEYSHRLNLPYESDCTNVHGHTGRIIITISADKVNNQNMIIDFAEMKKNIQLYFKDLLDHTLILNKTDILASLLANETKLFLIAGNPTAENLSRLIHNHTVKILNKMNLKFSKLSVTFFETAKNSANYTSKKNSITMDNKYANLKIAVQDLLIESGEVMQANRKEKCDFNVTIAGDDWNITACWLNDASNAVCWYEGETKRDGVSFYRTFSADEICMPKIEQVI